MNKTFRQGQILKLLREKQIHTQEDLAQELRESFGIPATQVTLSRDMRELGLVKTQDGYKQIAFPGRPDLATIAAELLRDIRLAQNLVVLRTAPGNANALAVAMDQEQLPEVVGTIAGDDTILVITSDMETAEKLRARFLDYVSKE